MQLIERYILKITASAFVACLMGLTAVIWITQALRELDLITGKGQTILVFLTVTGLSLPTLITVISPVALFIATIYALNRLNGDSELIVMSAAGMAPWRLVRPFLALLGWSRARLVHDALRHPGELPGAARPDHPDPGDFISSVVKEGQFTTLESGITFHYRERSNGALLGIFMQDRREEGRTIVYLAERGQAVDIEGQSYLVLEKGSVHRQQVNSRDSSIVDFERYAIDLAAFNQEASDTVYKPRERSTAQLVFPDTEEWLYKYQPGRFRAELHDRLSSWLYPIAVMLIAFAALGDARTTRQGRGTAVAVAIVAVVILRILGFAASGAAVRSSAAVVGVYGAPLAAIAIAAAVAFQGARARAFGAGVMRWVDRIALPRLPRLRRA
jgi:lipopolysaccharide export system permease protein